MASFQKECTTKEFYLFLILDNNIPVETETLSELTCPLIGILIMKSEFFITN